MPGGFECDGASAITDVCQAQFDAAASYVQQHDIHAVAICGIFSPINSSQEETASEMLVRAVDRLHPGTGFGDKGVGHSLRFRICHHSMALELTTT